ncbi:MAG: PEP-CTERM sorting domain-containing protein [Candidatus Acidiferrales bacterium]
MKMLRGFSFCTSTVAVVLLAASALLGSQAAFAVPVTCSHGKGRPCVQLGVAHPNSGVLRGLSSAAGNNFSAKNRSFDFSRGDGRIILPGPQAFRKQFGDLEFQAQTPGTPGAQSMPEPSTIVLLATGLLGMAIGIRRIH